MNVGPTADGTTEAVALDPMDEFRTGVDLLKNDYPQKALVSLWRAFESDKRNPYFSSFLGLALARAQRKWDQACDLCETAVQLGTKEIQFHLNLGEVYALAGRRAKALDALDHALELFGQDSRLKRARSRVQNRRRPILPFFGRKNFLNRELGKLRHRIVGPLT